MNLSEGWKNILLQKCYRISESVVLCGRGRPARVFIGKNLWARGSFPAGESPAATLDP